MPYSPTAVTSSSSSDSLLELTLIEYRQFVLNTFAQTGGNKEMKVELLGRLPNGNLRRSDKIEVYVPPGSSPEHLDRVHGDVATCLVMCLTGIAFRVYPRHRWLRADLAMDQVGLALAIHGLGIHAYYHMHKMVGVKLPRGDTLDSTLAPAQPLQPGEMDHYSEDRDPGAGMDEVETQADLAGPDEEDAEDKLEPQRRAEHRELPSADEMARRLAHTRQVALTWLRRRPLADLIGARLLMAPLTRVLSDYVTRSGQAWSTAGRGSLAAAMQTVYAPEILAMEPP